MLQGLNSGAESGSEYVAWAVEVWNGLVSLVLVKQGGAHLSSGAHHS